MCCTVLQATDGLFFGGGQRHILLLAKHINRDLFRIIVLSHQDGEFRLELEKAGISVCVINLFRFFKIVRLINKSNVKIIHTHSTRWSLLFRATKFLHRKPVVVTLHGYHERKYKYCDKFINKVLRWIRVKIDRFLNKFASSVICVSEEDRQYLIENCIINKDKAVVINNGIEPSWFRRNRKSLSDNNKKQLTVLCIARFHFQKGHKYLIQAIPEIIRKYPQTKFIFIGDGNLLNKMQNYAYQELSLPQKKVVFLGTITDVYSYLEQCDIFVLPSLWEGMPLALIEASAKGVPIVATDVPGNREIVVDQETGLLVNPQSAMSLDEGIEKLILNTELRKYLGFNARQRAIKLFNVERMVSKIENLYKIFLNNDISS